MVLRIAGKHFLPRATSDLPGVAGRDGARIDGEKVAPGRQHIETAARRSAGRARRDEASGERAQEAERFGRAAGGDALLQRLARVLVERQAGGEAVGVLRRAAEHMQSVADPHVLEVAEPGVERDQSLLGRLAFRGAFPEQAGRLAPLQDQRRDRSRAPRIEPLRLGKFVEQAFQFERCPLRSGGDQRRRQMADRRRADAALGLRRLAGIVDDEGIDHRRRRRGELPARKNPTARPPCPAATRACHGRRAGSARRPAPCG